MLLSKEQLRTQKEPYNFCIHSAQGELVAMDVMAHTKPANCFTQFAGECYDRYSPDASISVQTVTDDTFVCWDERGNILAIMSLYDDITRYSK